MALSRQLQSVKQRGFARQQDELSLMLVIWRYLVNIVLLVPKHMCKSLGMFCDDVKRLYALVAPSTRSVVKNEGKTKKKQKKTEKTLETDSSARSCDSDVSCDIQVGGSDAKTHKQLDMASRDTVSSETQEQVDEVAVKKHAVQTSDRVKTQGILIGFSIDEPTVETSNAVSSKRKPRRRRKSRAVKSLGKETTDPAAEEQTCTTDNDVGISSRSQSSSNTSLTMGKNDDAMAAKRDHHQAETSPSASSVSMPTNDYHNTPTRKRTRRSYTLGSFMTKEVKRQIFSKKKPATYK